MSKPFSILLLLATILLSKSTQNDFEPDFDPIFDSEVDYILQFISEPDELEANLRTQIDFSVTPIDTNTEEEFEETVESSEEYQDECGPQEQDPIPSPGACIPVKYCQMVPVPRIGIRPVYLTRIVCGK